VARAQTARRVGAFMSFAATDPETQACLTVFAQGLHELGWALGDIRPLISRENERLGDQETKLCQR